MLPPILDIYVVWHPKDTEGQCIAGWLLDHFHGTPYIGLIGGAVEVYTRSAPWIGDSDSPRPMPFQEPLPHGLPAPRVTAVVPVLGVRLARAVQSSSSDWSRYLDNMLSTVQTESMVGIFPIRLPDCAGGGFTTPLDQLQAMDPDSAHDPRVLCRELSQQVAQLIGDPLGDRLTVFISHTKKYSPYEEPDYVNDLVNRVRSRIANTHLSSYFDSVDLQPGSDWENELLCKATSSGLLAVRTDRYAGREWCQWEFLTAKRFERPIVTLNAIRRSEERGSFLMDHVPMVGYNDRCDDTRNRSIDEALNLLVDRSLRRALWNLQKQYMCSLGVDWAPVEAPEPVTIISWLLNNRNRIAADARILVIHPDPPLGCNETKVVKDLFALATFKEVDIVTPRTYESRRGSGP